MVDGVNRRNAFVQVSFISLVTMEFLITGIFYMFLYSFQASRAIAMLPTSFNFEVSPTHSRRKVTT
jgi:hypothetical protein